MIDRNIVVDLNDGSSLEEAAKTLREIAKILEDKLLEVAEKLADVGIKVATGSAGDDYANYITFQKAVTDKTEGSVTVCMYADNVGELIRRWGKDGTKSAAVNAVMMNEVGSGWFAENPDGLSGAGQGTFPGQKYAFSPRGWFWVDSSGKHHSYGENGHLSMHKAYAAMEQEVDRVVSEVFR